MSILLNWTILVIQFITSYKILSNIMFIYFNLLIIIIYVRCSIEDDIMGQFQYSANKTTAVVNFQAHKFPYTTSVYYQCHVHLCLKANGGCANTVTFFLKTTVIKYMIF